MPACATALPYTPAVSFTELNVLHLPVTPSSFREFGDSTSQLECKAVVLIDRILFHMIHS